MTLNFVIPVSMVIEGIMLAVQSVAYAYNNQRFRPPIDEIYLAVASFCLLTNFGWILRFKKEGRKFGIISRMFRAVEGVAVLVVGSLLIWNAVINEEENCYTANCQMYEIKLAAGVIALIDGLFYFLTPTRSPDKISEPSSAVILQNGVYIVKPKAGENDIEHYYIPPPTSHHHRNELQLKVEQYHGAGQVPQYYPYYYQRKDQQDQWYPHLHRIPRITEYYVNQKPTGFHNPNYRQRRASTGEIGIRESDTNVAFTPHHPTVIRNNVPVTEL